ncbi:hypothetical protein EsH8_I_000601 [Colletotrichum jinshuiense]
MVKITSVLYPLALLYHIKPAEPFYIPPLFNRTNCTRRAHAPNARLLAPVSLGSTSVTSSKTAHESAPSCLRKQEQTSWYSAPPIPSAAGKESAVGLALLSAVMIAPLLFF